MENVEEPIEPHDVIEAAMDTDDNKPRNSLNTEDNTKGELLKLALRYT